MQRSTRFLLVINRTLKLHETLLKEVCHKYGLSVVEAEVASFLHNNPGKDGILFNDHHPYFPKSCASCPFAATGKKIFSLLDGRKNSCYECKHVSKKIHVDKERNKEIYKKYLNNPDYYGVKYDEESGGVLAIHKGHNFDKQNGAFGISRGEYEIYASNVLFKNGYRVIMQNEQNDIGVKSADMLLNGVKCDIKGIEKNGKFTIKSSFRKANSQESEIIALYFHDTSKYSEVYINEQWNIFMFYNKSPLHIKEIICISKDDIISKFEIKKSGLSQVE